MVAVLPLPQTPSFGTDPQFLGHSIHPNAFYPKGSRKKGGGSGGLTQDQEALGGKHVVMISTGLSSFVAVPVVPYQEKIVSALEAEPSYGMPFVRQLVGGMSSFGVEQRRAPTKIQFGNGNGRAWSKAALLKLLQESCGNSILDDILGLGRRVIQGEAKQIVPRDCSARKVSGTCVIFFVGSGPRATRPL